MTATLQTTIVRLLGQTLADTTNLDPGNALDLTETVRDHMNAAAAKAYERQADDILAPYGCYMLGNGEIIRRNISATDALEWDEEAIREELAMIDISALLDDYLED